MGTVQTWERDTTDLGELMARGDKVYTQNDLEVARQLGAINDRLDSAARDSLSRHSEIQSSLNTQAGGLANLRTLFDQLRNELADIRADYSAFEATMLEEVSALHKADVDLDTKITVLRESTDTRFGQVSNEQASLRLALGQTDQSKVPIAWLRRSWKVVAIILGLIATGVPGWIDELHKLGILK